jgi:hypothetical protein
VAYVGGDRIEFYRNLMEECHFTPLQISNEFTILQLIAFFKAQGDAYREYKEIARNNSLVMNEYLERERRTKCQK